MTCDPIMRISLVLHRFPQCSYSFRFDEDIDYSCPECDTAPIKPKQQQQQQKLIVNSKFGMANDRDKCVFCRIYDNKETTEILYKDDDYAVFCDIKPAAKHHYLVITREHIPNAKQLKSEEKSIVERLVEIGKQVLAEKSGDASDARFGFHWPPFNSISHLHLHVISPASSMGTIGSVIFRENSWWFVTPDYVLSRL